MISKRIYMFLIVESMMEKVPIVVSGLVLGKNLISNRLF